MSIEELRTFGLSGPERILSRRKSRGIGHYCNSKERPAPMEWRKGCAVTDQIIYSIATDPKILSRVIALLGENVILWGACPISRDRRRQHAWHVDVECAERSGAFVSVWLALLNCTKRSSLVFVSRSHKFDKTIQEVARWNETGRNAVKDQDALNFARELDENAELVIPGARDGEAIFFDGRIWHASFNKSWRRRTALLLQYARADAPVRIPDFQGGKWPFVFQESRLPPVIPVSGKAVSGINRVLDPPPKPSMASVTPRNRE